MRKCPVQKTVDWRVGFTVDCLSMESRELVVVVYPRTRTAPMGRAVRLKKGGKDLFRRKEKEVLGIE